MNRVFILIGSSSDFSESFKNILNKNNEEFITISRSGEPNVTVEEYLDDCGKIVDNISDYKNLYFVFFNGFIAENRPFQSPSIDDISKTVYINYTIPFTLTKVFKENGLNVKKYIYISSMAAIKPRNKNFIYGLTKLKLEKSIPKLTNEYLFLRFGKINTKLSKSHEKVPFTLSKDEAAKILYKKIEKKKIVYPSLKFNLIAILIYFLPIKIIDKAERGVTNSG
jgi:short-subunit dehydrogenase